MLGLWLGWLPFGSLVMHLQESVLPPPWSVVVALAYLGSFMAAGLRFGGTRCPACGRPFVSLFARKVRAPWSWRCDNCGARIGEPLGR